MSSMRGMPLGAAGLLVCLGLLACQMGPVGSSPTDPSQLAVGPSEVPQDLPQCQGSGPIERYLADMKPRNQEAYRSLQDSWTQLKSEGAKGATVRVFAKSTSACSARIGTGPGRNLANLVIAFADDHAAVAAYQHGIFGFPTPAAEEQVPGLSKGVATGLSENAWVAQRNVAGRALYVAWWQDRAIAAFLVSADLDSTESRRAAEAVESRIR